MRESERLSLNALTLWTTRLLGVVPQLIILPFLLEHLGEAQYGIYVLAWSLLTTLELAEQGMATGVVKYGSEYLAGGQTTEMNRVLSTAGLYGIVVALLGCAGIFGWVWLAPESLTAVSSAYPEQAGFAFLMIGILLLLIFPLTPFTGLIFAQQRHDIVGVSRLVGQYMKLGFVVLWFSFVGTSLNALMIISVVALWAPKAFLVIVAYRLVPGLRYSLRLVNRRAFKLLLSFGGVITLCSLCVVLRDTGLKWFMGVFISTAFVAHMAIIYSPVGLLIGIIQGMTLTVMPTASKHKAMDNKVILQELLLRGTRYTTVLCCGLFITMFFLLKPLVALWLGPAYTHLVKYMLVVFVAAAFQMTSSCAHHILRGTGRLRIVFLNSVVGQTLLPVGTTLFFYVWLSEPYWAFVCGMFLGHVVFGLMQLGFCCGLLRIGLREFLAFAYGEVLLIAGGAFALIYVLVAASGAQGLLYLTALTITGLIVASASFYTLFFRDEERRLAKTIVYKFANMARRIQPHRSWL